MVYRFGFDCLTVPVLECYGVFIYFPIGMDFHIAGYGRIGFERMFLAFVVFIIPAGKVIVYPFRVGWHFFTNRCAGFNPSYTAIAVIKLSTSGVEDDCVVYLLIKGIRPHGIHVHHTLVFIRKRVFVIDSELVKISLRCNGGRVFCVRPAKEPISLPRHNAPARQV